MNQPTELRIPLVAESLSIDTKKVVDSVVRISTHTDAIIDMAKTSLSSEEVEITRVAIGHEVSVAPLPRTEGDVTIIPVLEERMVVEKRLFLTEEVHVRRIRTSDTVGVPVELRKQHVTIERAENPNTNKEIDQ